MAHLGRTPAGNDAEVGRSEKRHHGARAVLAMSIQSNSPQTGTMLTTKNCESNETMITEMPSTSRISIVRPFALPLATVVMLRASIQTAALTSELVEVGIVANGEYTEREKREKDARHDDEHIIEGSGTAHRDCVAQHRVWVVGTCRGEMPRCCCQLTGDCASYTQRDAAYSIHTRTDR